MSDLERTGMHATQCRKTQNNVFPNHPGPQCKETTTKSPGSANMASINSHLLHVPSLYQTPRETSPIPRICFHTLQELKQFDHLGLRLDPMMNMKAAVAFILEKANKGHSLALAVSYSLCYVTSTTPTLPSAVRQLKCSTCGNHESFQTSYSTSATSQTLHRFKRYRPPSTGHSATHCMFMGTPQLYLLTLVFPPCTSHRTCSSPNSDSGCTPSPSTLFSIFYGNYGSPYYKLCPWTHLNTACRLQSVTWTWLGVTLPPLCHKT